MARTAPTRHVVLAALTLLVIGGIGAVRAGFAGADFMADLEQIEPPLARSEPFVDPAPGPRLARRVVLVVIDGLRYDKSYELPFLDELRRRGADTNAESHYPTWSRPNYVSILSGVPPSASGVRTNHHATPVMLDTLMDRARAAGLRVATATDYEVLPRMFLRRRDGSRAPIELDLDDEEDSEVGREDPMARAAARAPDADFASPFDDARYAPWPGGFSEAGSAIVAEDAELVVLLVGAVDVAGHGRGGESRQYRDAALIADNALARVLAKFDFTEDAVIVTADHGHTDRGGHGGIEPEVLQVPLIAAGAGVRPGAVAIDARLIDIAPTVAALLGIPAPGHGLGRTLDELLVLDDASLSRRRTADQTRLAITRLSVSISEQNAAAVELEDRAWRLVLVGVGALLAGFFARLLIRRRVVVLDVRVLLVSVPAFFISYAGSIALFGKFSPSFLPAQGHIAWTLVQYGGVALVVQLFVSMWALRNRHAFADRLAAANGIALTGFMLTIILAGVIWAYFPPPFATVPSPTWLVVIPAINVAVTCIAVNVVLTLFVEVAIFIARAWQRDTRALAE